MNNVMSSIVKALESFAPTLEWMMPYILIALAIVLAIILLSAVVVHFVRKSGRKSNNSYVPTDTILASTMQSGIQNQ